MNAALTEEQRNELARSDFAYQAHFAGTPRCDFKAAARTGGLDHLYAEHVAHEAELAAAEKAAKQVKNAAWRAKNLPKLAQAKAIREQTEADRKIAAVRFAKDEAARRDAERIVIAANLAAFAATPKAAVATVNADVAAPSNPARRTMPTRGIITEDDPSVWGSKLLGYEGESWASFHAAHCAN